MTRIDRKLNELRNIEFTPNVNKNALSSVLTEFGDTQVLVCVNYEDKVPLFLKNTGSGWLTAEYAMLPSATNTRNKREVKSGHQSGRSSEIQRLIGRSLRSCLDLGALGELSLIIDCDVLVADGGTRTASISGGYVALDLAIQKLIKKNLLKKNPIVRQIAAISLGILDQNIYLDLNYEEDSAADVDLNIVMDENKKIIEIQGTGEKSTFSIDQLNHMLNIAGDGIAQIINLQKTHLIK